MILLLRPLNSSTHVNADSGGKAGLCEMFQKQLFNFLFLTDIKPDIKIVWVCTCILWVSLLLPKPTFFKLCMLITSIIPLKKLHHTTFSDLDPIWVVFSQWNLVQFKFCRVVTFIKKRDLAQKYLCDFSIHWKIIDPFLCAACHEKIK